MKKLVYLIPAVVALALPACGDDSSGSGTDGDASSGGDGSTSGSASDPTVDPSGSTGNETEADPTIDPDSSSGGDECEPGSECGVEGAECGAGDVCLACICVPDGKAELCEDGWGGGEYANCAVGDACGASDLQSACVGGPDDESSLCLFLGCEDVCDCPAPAEGFEDLARCEDLFGPGGMLDDVNDCFLDCSGGEACPDGMFCSNGVCFTGTEPPPETGFSDCVNEPGCDNANEGCIADNPDDPGLGFCTSGCTEAADCNPAPETGDAAVTCDDLTGDDMGNCFLDCSTGDSCPDGMICAFDQFCAWEFIPPMGFDDCAGQPDTVCDASETCIETTDAGTGTTEICAASGCTDPAADCLAPPATGDAPVACQNIDGMDGDECVLDCSGGQTCPDGAVCTDAGYCSYELPTFTFQEDFSSGMLGMGWTVHDVDGNTPSMSTSFVTDGWAVSDIVDMNFAAISTSWYTPPGQSDDWIISPAITLAGTATLGWHAMALDADFPDGYQVFVVPTTVTEFTDFIGSGDPTDFLALDSMVVPSVDPVFEVANEEPAQVWRSVDLAAVAGQEVHIAFRNNSNDLNLLAIDDIWVTE